MQYGEAEFDSIGLEHAIFQGYQPEWRLDPREQWRGTRLQPSFRREPDATRHVTSRAKDDGLRKKLRNSRLFSTYFAVFGNI
jgi:hypothetical protein